MSYSSVITIKPINAVLENSWFGVIHLTMMEQVVQGYPSHINNHKTCQNKGNDSFQQWATGSAGMYKRQTSKARPMSAQQSAWGQFPTMAWRAGSEQNTGVPLSSQGRNQPVRHMKLQESVGQGYREWGTM